MTQSLVIIEKDQGITTVTMNRPEVKNALSRELSGTLYNTFEDLAHDEETKVIILTGAGDAFSAGLDLKELAEKGLGTLENPSPGAGSLAQVMAETDSPIIGAVNGVAITGGFEMALACDILIASTNAYFADTHARVGVIPGWGLSQKLPRIIGPGRAKELSFTGNFLSAEQAEKWGLVNRVVAPDQLMPTCLKLAKEMAGCVPGMVRDYKALIDQGYASTLEQGLIMERDAHIKQAPGVHAADIGQRRLGVQERGRQQKSG